MVDEIISYAIDSDAVGFECFAVHQEDDQTFINAFCVLENVSKIILAKGKNLPILNMLTLKRIGLLKGHTNIVTCCCVLPTGKVISGSWDKTIRI